MFFINFFISYLLFLLVSSIVITSFFCITRGYVEVMPDGSKRRYGKVLRNYYFFWFRETGTRQIKYVDDELANLLDEIRQYYKEPLITKGDIFKEKSVSAFEATVSRRLASLYVMLLRWFMPPVILPRLS